MNEKQVAEEGIRLLRPMVAMASLDERMAYVKRHPVVISEVCLQFAFSVSQLRQILLELLPLFGVRISQEGGGMHLSSNPDRYPVGEGPIETIWKEMEDGAISAERALALVSERGVPGDLIYTYLKAVADKACRELTRGNRLLAARRLRIVVEATSQLDARTSILGDGEVWRMRMVGGWFWIEAAASALVELPDGRIFHHALACGRALAAEAQERGLSDERGLMLERLGVLMLDPYSVNRNLNNYDFEIKMWRDRLSNELGQAEAAKIEAQFPMPEPKEALAQADDLLTQAIAVRNPEERSTARTALVQCLRYRGYLGEPVTEERIREEASQALRELEGSDKYEKIAKVQSYVASIARNDKDVDPLLDRSYESLVETMGATELLALARHRASAVVDTHPVAGLAILTKLAPLLRPGPSPEEEQRSALWLLQLQLLVAHLQARDSALPLREAAGLPETVSRRQAEAADRLRRAMASGAENREPEGLVDLAAAIELLPSLDDEFAPALDYLRAGLHGGAGTVAFNARPRRVSEAASHYTEALALHLRLHVTGAVLQTLDNLKDVAEIGDAAATEATIAGLIALANAIEAMLGDKGTTKVQAIYDTFLTRWSFARRLEQELQHGTLFDVMRLAKGRRLASTLAATPTYVWKSDAEAVRRLTGIEEARARALEREGDPELAADGDLERRLMGPIGSRDRHAGMTERERFENLRYTLDRYLNQHVLGSTLREMPRARSVAEIDIDPPGLRFALADVQERLEAETVLLDFLVTDYGPTQQAVLVLAIVKEGFAFDVSLLTTSGPEGGAESNSLSALAELVANLRRELQVDPQGEQDVATEARALLRPARLLGNIGVFLERMRTQFGKKHLCLVPHRELHYVPFHLLGEEGRPLADDWAVTYLPNLQMLFTDPAPARRQGRSMTAVGVEFAEGNPWGLPPIDMAHASARGVAEMFGEEPLNHDPLTDHAVLDALADSRYAYVYTHGVQCVYAPAFHRLFCAPDGRGSGAIDAYEIQGRDLRGVEVLGTAACETALGRFDAGDNLTGLPASFFQAGVKSMVGTLWEVRADAADEFFLAFFLELANETPKRDAFQNAQRKIRRAYPDFRDWGAFYFMGV